MEPCQEPMCNEPATQEWKGTKLCKFHFFDYVDWGAFTIESVPNRG